MNGSVDQSFWLTLMWIYVLWAASTVIMALIYLRPRGAGQTTTSIQFFGLAMLTVLVGIVLLAATTMGAA